MKRGFLLVLALGLALTGVEDSLAGASGGVGHAARVATIGYQNSSEENADGVGAVNPKKGLGIYKKQRGFRPAQMLHLAWYYDWGIGPQASVPTGVEFVPMVWGWYGDKSGKAAQTIANLKSTLHSRYLLGFNEPDNKTQSNMSVSSALKVWPILMTSNLPLGAPGAVHADGPWMQRFMAGAKAAGDRVDFVPIHWYGMPNAKAFLGYVRRVHEMYHMPVWITEFANVDWSTKNQVSKKFTAHDVAQFLRIVLPALNHMSYVKRYAWFTSRSPMLRASSLFHKDGRLTEAGRVYASE